MIKRITCTVVSSVPLSEAPNALMRTRRSNNRYRKADDVITVNVRVRAAGSAATYTSRPGTPMLSIDHGLTGRFLDCHV